MTKCKFYQISHWPTPGVIQEMKWLEVELAKKAIGKAIMEQ